MAGAYREAWAYLARPGSWWTADERLSIAAASRDAVNCELCAQRKSALSPFAINGEHDGEGSLPADVLDAVHRVRTDPARLTGSWVTGLMGERFTPGHYVEMVSVIVSLVSIDSFHEVLGLPLEPLPDPLDGDPDRYTPPGAAVDVAWVPMIQPENLTEKENDIYFGAPQTGNVIRAMSLVPDAVRMLHTLSAVMYVPTPDVMNMSASGILTLSRPQIELVAARTSAINDCFY
jgi:hypothetical protein